MNFSSLANKYGHVIAPFRWDCENVRFGTLYKKFVVRSELNQQEYQLSDLFE